MEGLLGRLVERRSALAKEANGLEGELARLRQESAVAQARREDTIQRHERLQVERETVATEMAELERELARQSGDHQQLVEELTEAERRHAVAEEEQNAASEALEGARAERQSLKEASAGRRGRLDLLRERLAAQDREMERLRSEVAEGGRQVAEWRSEAQRLDQRRDELTSQISAAETELAGALEQRGDSGDAVVQAQETLDAKRAEIRDLEKRTSELRARREEVRGEVEELRIRQAGLKQEADHVTATFREEFLRPEPAPARLLDGDADEDDEADEAAACDEAPAETAGSATPATLLSANDDNGHGSADVVESELPSDTETASDVANENREEDGDAPSPTAEPTAQPAEIPLAEVAAMLAEIEAPNNLAELETDLARTRAALDRLGPVNILAVEEYAEQEERNEFLTAQRADVADSVKRLKETIREINATSSERFRETFHQVNESFGRIFQRLFRGGEAEMRLLDDEDVLESGIEIVAKPPGKRMQNIMLMSGGEKALTAIALLFGLFEAKPSPFCILDEVDAPLDDVNTLRFVEMLQEMASETQFLVITHNKITMEAASTLYGVTMQEKGVSKLVAVELDDVQPQRATA